MKKLKTHVYILVNKVKSAVRRIDKKLIGSNFLQDFKTYLVFLLPALFLVGVFQYGQKNWSKIKDLLLIGSWFSFFKIFIFVALGVFFAYLIVFLISTFKRVQHSGRWDAVCVIVGALLTAVPFSLKIKEYLLLSIAIIFISYLLLVSLKKKERDSFFLVDAPEEDENNDWLDFKEDAQYFAEQVLQQTSKNSIVFGLDAPWGAGKSTFLNFCKNYWKSNVASKPLVFEFEPLNFIGADDIFDKFANEFRTTITNELYVPSFKSTFNRYVKMLKNVSVDLWGGKFSLEGAVGTPDALKELKEVLISANKKMIVIIDDLDRLSLSDIKTILDAIKKSFVLPNVSYILCYSTDNIDTFTTNLKRTDFEGNITGGVNQNFKIQTTANEKPDRQKITEYFEKVINVKKTLVVSREKIKTYLIAEIVKLSSFVLPGGETFKLLSVDSLAEAEIAIEKIFDPSEFDDYVHYIGDLRKVKRFLNILKMQINNLNLNTVDIDFCDLLHLFLVYINFPQIFRKIYITETDGARGFFSLNYVYDDKPGTSFANSDKYKKYLETLEPSERFLVSKIFDQGRLDQKAKENPKINATTALFNGDLGYSRNLERYLKLIVRNQKPQNQESYNFHFGNVLRFIRGESIDQIFTAKEYDLSLGERVRLAFFSILFSNLDQVNFDRAQEFMDYLLESAKNFASLETDTFDTGIRKNIDLYLVDLLDKKGWKDESGNSSINTDDNIIEIAKRIFGETPYENRGIIEELADPQRGLNGFFDLMSFRLYCCRDRGGSFYNVYRALGLHADPNHAGGGPSK